MKILIQITHPAHVHLYKNYLWELERMGHEIEIVVRDKDITINLLDAYNFDYDILIGPGAINPTSPFGLARQLKFEWGVYKKAKKIQPDLLTGLAAPSSMHVGKIFDIPTISYINNEHATLENKLSVPFADTVCTHNYFWEEFGKKHVRYPSYHELAYLHPNRFDPDQTIFDDLEVSPDDTIVILRLVAWNASHDIGHVGFQDPQEVIEAISSTGAKVLVTSEKNANADLDAYHLDIPPHQIHDLLYYSDLFIGESGTMACESAVLGTPAIYISSIRLGYLDELEARYGLVHNFSGPNKQENALQASLRILREDKANRYLNSRKELLNDKCDMTDCMIDMTEELVGEL